VVRVTLIVMWAHSRSASTAFGRMMIERGDVAVVHEPLLALTEVGRVPLPDRERRTRGIGENSCGENPPRGRRSEQNQPELVATTPAGLLDRLVELGERRHVFVKEVLDYEYEYLPEHPARLRAMTHTFLVRHPRRTIGSHYAVKPHVTCAEIGYERLYRLFELAWSVTGRRPLVLRAERLVSEPATAVAEYCDYVGLPFLPHALRWRAGERPEWRRTRRWHVDADRSAGFEDRGNTYPDTVDNNPTLRSFYDHHLPFYERLVRHAN
jgi:hypothetical protein